MITAPATITDHPLAAPAIIKTILKSQYDYKFFDLNAEFNIQLKNNNFQLIRDYFLFGKFVPGSSIEISAYIDQCVDRIIKQKPDWVGISLFSYQCQRFTNLFCRRLKALCPNIKIVIGGSGIIENGIEGDRNLGELLYSLGAIDLYIVGEAETQILEKLKTKLPSKHWNQEININVEEFPDYSDYDFNLFEKKSIPIIGSRGCVRKCTFCDIHSHWKKFVYRDGDNIFKEMLHQYQLHGINQFRFKDSLVNGSMKAYRDMITALSVYNQQSHNPFKWHSQFIARSEKQMNQHDWQLTKQSGADHLAIGVENLNEHIRDHMQKKFSNRDLFFVLDQAKKNNIKLSFLMICGYITETDQDHLQQIEIFKKISDYADILEITLGTTLGILPGTPLHRDHKKYGIILGNNENSWINPSTGNTFEKRLYWRKDLERKLIEIGFTVDKNNEQHLLLEAWK